MVLPTTVTTLHIGDAALTKSNIPDLSLYGSGKPVLTRHASHVVRLADFPNIAVPILKMYHC